MATDATSDTKTASPKAVKTYVDTFVPTDYATTIPSGGLLPNVIYRLGKLSSATTIELTCDYSAFLGQKGYFYQWNWSFWTGSTAPTVTFVNSITEGNNYIADVIYETTPVIKANCLYEFNAKYVDNATSAGGPTIVVYMKEISLS